ELVENCRHALQFLAIDGDDRVVVRQVFFESFELRFAQGVSGRSRFALAPFLQDDIDNFKAIKLQTLLQSSETELLDTFSRDVLMDASDRDLGFLFLDGEHAACKRSDALRQQYQVLFCFRLGLIELIEIVEAQSLDRLAQLAAA